MTRRSLTWSPGALLTHRSNPELGIGRVTAVDARTIVVDFPRSGTTLRLASNTDALRPVDLGPGRPVRVYGESAINVIVALRANGAVELDDGRVVPAHAVWPVELEGALLDRLAAGDLDDERDFLVRMKILHLLETREADGLGSFLGGRIRLFPHQLYVAERACASDPVRWLLADEVGLGKTIEAALILNHLTHTRRVERCLVVAPESLTVQWLGELWRKYHQVFTLLDSQRLADVARDFGATFNPFDVHRRAIVALERLVERPELTRQAVEAGIDLLVVDEAQRLRRPPNHPGEPAWRAVAPIAALGRHVLLLSATPLEDDAHGFFRLLQLLRPEEFPEDEDVAARLAEQRPLPPCTSATRRRDIGGLPPRVGIVVDPGEPAGARRRATANAPTWELREAVERMLRASDAPHAVARERKADRIRRALASGAALHAVLGPAETELRAQAAAMDARDPRVDWLVSEAPRWRDAREKTLVFVAHRETLEMLRTALGQRAQLATGAFHEDLPTSRRDIEVARFREPEGPSLLVSTEAGGEGRNFEFCRRLVLFDLPWNPSIVEQRIGRLDRIGRRIPVEIVYFRPPSGIGRDVVRLFEALGVFREPLAGLEPQLAQVERAIEELALDPAGELSDERLAAIVAEAHAARTRVREAAFRQLHRDPYRPEMAERILARVPADLDALNEETVVAACERLGLAVEQQRGRRAYSIELGSGALVESLPGVPGEATFVGTFDREEAVERETLDFFASGHPLVEGIFSYFEDHPLGRVVRLALESNREEEECLVAIYKDGPAFDVVAFGASGRARPDVAAMFRRRTLRARRATSAEKGPGKWRDVVKRLGERLDPRRQPHAVVSVAVKRTGMRA